ncbi:MAG: MBL fold metallo-hydrolase [Negativicutes bacterium]|nr:MBL fold metallo-hydrolase [Negativicutes bacterium]
MIHILELDIEVFGNTMRIHPVLIADDEGATLVDVGHPGAFGKLKQAVEAAGVLFGSIRRVIITHQDWDHMGSLPDVLAAGGAGLTVYAHSDEKPYINGSVPFIKMTPERIAARLATLPENMRTQAAAVFANLPTARVDVTVTDGEILPFHGGITVLHTPGHTPGHICLFLPSHRLLIAGDELRVENGALVGPADIHTVDMGRALVSLDKLTGLDADRVVCYHGGVYGPGAAAKIAMLATAARTI